MVPAQPRTGLLIWTGRASRGDLLTITGNHASTGTLSGALPGGPVRIRIYPAVRTSTGITAFSSNAGHASVPVSRGAAVFTFDPRHATDLTLFEAPARENDWKRIVIRVNTDIAACIIDWRVD
jgi:hypothetical protein